MEFNSQRERDALDCFSPTSCYICLEFLESTSSSPLKKHLNVFEDISMLWGKLVMFEWIAMFMPVSNALLRQWLTIMRCCTCLVSNSHSFLHALPNLTPRSNFDQFKWIRRNYCLSLSFPWSASPCEIWHISGQFKWIKLKFVTACEHCKVLYTSYHPKISIPSHL